MTFEGTQFSSPHQRVFNNLQMSQVRTLLRRSGSCLCIFCSSEDWSVRPWLLYRHSPVLLSPQPLCIRTSWGEGLRGAHVPGVGGEAVRERGKAMQGARILGGGTKLCRGPSLREE